MPGSIPDIRLARSNPAGRKNAFPTEVAFCGWAPTIYREDLLELLGQFFSQLANSRAIEPRLYPIHPSSGAIRPKSLEVKSRAGYKSETYGPKGGEPVSRGLR